VEFDRLASKQVSSANRSEVGSVFRRGGQTDVLLYQNSGHNWRPFL